MIDPESNTILTNCVYKYGPAKYALITLENLTIGFSKLSEFNDPYESDYRIAHYFHSIEDEKKLLDGTKGTFGKIRKLAKDYLDAVRVSCFSRIPNNNLMWAHYSRHHTGVCYAFEFIGGQQHPFQTDNLGWGNIIYSSLLPELKIYQDQTTEGMFQTQLSDVILTKSQDWSYEHEVRFFKRQDENFLYYKPEKLKAIIIGRRISDGEEALVTEAVTKFNNKHRTGLRVLYAHRVASSFALGISTHANFRKDSEGAFSASIPVCDNILSQPLTTNRKK
ncbi:MAG: DUF2971 domain-containing protein [Candidatus Thiodiazotropha endolucinida]|nr:DUF2971 domain-containing protein [Candidatus Thiodiazotropha taylori]MCW4318207.1 DUF2971 domain-containing protein [Candidatus Thiodiazotropha taylori]